MDENQRQDWWPENFSNDFSRNPESSGQPQDTLQNTTQNSDFTDSLNEDRPSQEETYIPTAEPQQNQNDSYGWSNNQQQNQNDSYNWNNNQQQNQNDTYGWNNNQQQQNQGNPYGWNNSGNFNQPSGGPYYQQPPYRPSGNGMVAASLVMGILSLLLTCCGLSYVFGALGIIFALLSRKNGPMDPQAKIGIGLSIAGSVLGIVIIVVALLQDPSYYMDALKEYQQFYNEYENDDDYYDGYDDYDDYGNYDDYDDFFNQFKDFEDFGNQSGGYSDDLSYQLPSPASSL